MQRIVIAALVASTLACRKNDPAPAAQPAAELAAAKPDAPKPLVLTEAKLDAWLKYEKKTWEEGNAFMRGQGLVGGKTKERTPAEAAAEIVAAQEHAAAVEAAALKEAKLTREEAKRIEDLTHGVLLTKKLFDTYATVLKQMEQTWAAAPQEQKEQMKDHLADMRRKYDDLVNFKEQKEKFGAAAVALVLTREAVWTKMFDEMEARLHAK